MFGGKTFAEKTLEAKGREYDRLLRENGHLRVLLMTANRYVEGYAENENNHPQARDGARDLIRQIKDAI